MAPYYVANDHRTGSNECKNQPCSNGNVHTATSMDNICSVPKLFDSKAKLVVYIEGRPFGRPKLCLHLNLLLATNSTLFKSLYTTNTVSYSCHLITASIASFDNTFIFCARSELTPSSVLVNNRIFSKTSEKSAASNLPENTFSPVLNSIS